MSRALLHMDSGLLYEEARDFALQKNLSCWVSLANPEGLLDYIIDKRPPLVMPHVLGFKSLENATEYKDMGNISYKKKELETALKYYNSALIYCPVTDPLYPILLANRSAALYELEFYVYAREDVKEAMAKGYPEDKVHRLEVRNKRISDNLAKTADTSIAFNQKTAFAYCKVVKNPEIMTKIDQKFKMWMNLPLLNLGEPTFVHPALRLTTIKGMGRGMIVKEKVSKGTLLLKELPFDFAMSSEIFSRKKLTCQYCAVPIVFRVLPCSSCATSWYCSEFCLAGDRKRHKLLYCRTPEVRKVPALGRLGYQLYFQSKRRPPPLEKVFKVGNEKDFSKGTLKEGYYQGIASLKLLEGHEAEMDKHTFAEIFALSYAMLVSLNLPEADLVSLFQWTARAHANSFTVRDRHISLNAIYAYASQLNHSCLPNTFHLFVPGTHAIKVYASRDLEPGEQVFISYGPDSIRHTLEERKSMIQKTWHFDCSCKDCVDPHRKEAVNGKWIHALKCANPNCYEPVNPHGASCQACLTPIPECYLTFHSDVLSSGGEIPRHHRQDWESIEDFLETAESIYHPKSLALAKFYSHAADIGSWKPELVTRVTDLLFKSTANVEHVFGNPSIEYLNDCFSRMMTLKRASILDSDVLHLIKDNLCQLFSGNGGREELWEEVEDWKICSKLSYYQQMRETDPKFRMDDEFVNVFF